MYSTTNIFLNPPENTLPIVGVDHFAYLIEVNGAFLRRQPKNAIAFVRPDHAVLDKVPFVVPYVGNALRFFKPGLVFLQVARQRLALFLCALAFSNVLDRTKYFIRSARPISFHFALAVHGAYLSVWANKAVFRIGAHTV